MTDDELIEAAAAEVARKADRLDMTLQPTTVIQFTALLQLALRHPHVNAIHRNIARRFIDGARVFYADCPAVLEMIRRGDDPAHDSSVTLQTH